MKTRENLKRKIEKLFNGTGYASVLTNNILLSVNIALIFLIIASLFYPESKLIVFLEFSLGILFVIEYILRFWVAERKVRHMLSIFSVIDVLVIISLLSSMFVVNLGFLKIIRSLQVLRLFRTPTYIRGHEKSKFILRNKEIIFAFLSLVVFVFFTASLVFTFQVETNNDINTYLDAMYFTIATLTTTGFGDITLKGDMGRFLAIFIMIFGITLFIRVVKSIFRRPKFYYRCRACGLGKHDFDAIHCKHCGHTIKNSALN